MAQYIDKDAVVAEIERRIKINKECMLGLRNLDYYQGKVDALNDTISFIDTLEVKEVDLESLVRQVIDLYFKAGEHYNSVIKEERKEYGGSDLAIKLLGGIIDAKELSINYVLDKLKAQKGEEVWVKL